MSEAKEGKKRESRQQATEKLRELLHCGNERVELSAAKEILSTEPQEEAETGKIALEVVIRVVEG